MFTMVCIDQIITDLNYLFDTIIQTFETYHVTTTMFA